jgi:glycerophosphoryl diester phosphodiesterase
MPAQPPRFGSRSRRLLALLVTLGVAAPAAVAAGSVGSGAAASVNRPGPPEDGDVPVGPPPWSEEPGAPEFAPGPPPWAGQPGRPDFRPAPRTGNIWLDERRVANIAHAGGIFEAPQNTLFAFATAEGRGADVIEMDLHITADGHVVAIHDSTVNRTTDGEGCVVEHTLEEIKQLDAAFFHVPGQNPQPGLDEDAYPFRGVATGEQPPPDGFQANDFTVPTLEEVFQALPDTLMVLELKPTEVETRDDQVYDCPGALAAIPEEERPDLVAEVARLIDEYGMAATVMVASFIDPMMQRFVALAPHVDTSFPLLEGLAFYNAFVEGEEPPNPHGHKAIQTPVRLEFGSIVIEASAELVAFAQEHDIAVHFWTINDEAEMERLLDWGADGIITDRVQVLDQLLTARGEPRP